MNKFKALIASAFAAALVFATPVHAQESDQTLRVGCDAGGGKYALRGIVSINGVVTEGTVNEVHDLSDQLTSFTVKKGDVIGIRTEGEMNGLDVMVIGDKGYKPISGSGDSYTFGFVVGDEKEMVVAITNEKTIRHGMYHDYDENMTIGESPVKSVEFNKGGSKPVAGKNDKKVPEAGDPTSIAQLIALLGVSAAGIYESKKALKK